MTYDEQVDTPRASPRETLALLRSAGISTGRGSTTRSPERFVVLDGAAKVPGWWTSVGSIAAESPAAVETPPDPGGLGGPTPIPPNLDPHGR